MTEEDGRIEIPLWEGDVKAPPDRHAVPAWTLPPLEMGTLVTFGELGRWWAIDEGYAATPPEGTGEDESYGIVLFAEEAALQLRPHENPDPAQPMMARLLGVKTRDLWVYRDADDDRDVSDIEEWRPTGWFDRMPADDLTPPPIRRPRPARELPSLTGRRVRAYGAGEWHWLMAVTEPLAIKDTIAVKVVDLHQYGPMIGSRALPDGEPGLVSIHRLWAY